MVDGKRFIIQFSWEVGDETILLGWFPPFRVRLHAQNFAGIHSKIITKGECWDMYEAGHSICEFRFKKQTATPFCVYQEVISASLNYPFRRLRHPLRGLFWTIFPDRCLYFFVTLSSLHLRQFNHFSSLLHKLLQERITVWKKKEGGSNNHNNNNRLWDSWIVD